MFNRIKSGVKYIKPLLKPVFIKQGSALEGSLYLSKFMNAYKSNKYEEAEQYCKKAIYILKKNHANCMLYIWALESMGDIYIDKNEFGKAIKVIQKAGKVRRQVFGENHIEYSKYLNKMGEVHLDIGNFKKAEKWLIKSLQVKKKYYEKQHKSMISEYSLLLEVYGALKKYENVDKIYDEAMKLSENTKYKDEIYKGNEEIICCSYIASLNEQNKSKQIQEIVCEKLKYYEDKYKVKKKSCI